MLLAINAFARRQTAESPYSHWAGSEAELLSAVTLAIEEGDTEPGYRDGVTLVNLPPIGFFCGVVEVTPDTELVASFGARREGEAPFISVKARGEKLPAHACQAVIYRRDVLQEGGDEGPEGAEWEIISLNARPTLAPEPMTPMSMARNLLEMEGGTEAEYTAEDFAKAIVYWSTRAMRAE